MNPLKLLTASQLHRAADLKEKIGALETELLEILAPEIPGNGHRRWTAARRKKFIATMAAKRAAKPKRTMSAEARAKISAAAKRRWKVALAAGKNRL